MFRRDLLTGMGVLAFALAVLIVSRRYTLEARFFPQLIAGVLAVLALVMIARTLLRSEQPESYKLFEAPWKVLLVVVMTGLYIGGISLVGFTLASFLFIPLTAWIFGYRKVHVSAGAALLFVIGVAALFSGVLGLPMPPDLILSRL